MTIIREEIGNEVVYKQGGKVVMKINFNRSEPTGKAIENFSKRLSKLYKESLRNENSAGFL